MVVAMVNRSSGGDHGSGGHGGGGHGDGDHGGGGHGDGSNGSRSHSEMEGKGTMEIKSAKTMRF